MKRIALAILLVAAAGCFERQKPVVQQSVMATETERVPIDVQYVAIPKMDVHQKADVTSPVIGTYNFSEAISILAKQGEWVEIRTFDGSGWVKAADLMTGDQEKVQASNKTPRFYQPPAPVPRNVRGQVVMHAKVNTDGEVFDVVVVRNTTGIKELGDLNAKSLKDARFYPLIDNGQRKAFTYEHVVAYPVLE